ncbi:MAG TPA: hypothetical protein VL201_04275 [Patescibacteria group bacterium]|jgi:hypothetical protein|nr:hypothetical protein [Patescibacteria group bacterium]
MFQRIHYRALAFFFIVFFTTIKAAENCLSETLDELSKIDTQQLKTDLKGYCTTVNSVISKKYGKQIPALFEVERYSDITNALDNKFGCLNSNFNIMPHFNNTITINEQNYLISEDDSEVQEIHLYEKAINSFDAGELLHLIGKSTFLKNAWASIYQNIEQISYCNDQTSLSPLIIGFEYSILYEKYNLSPHVSILSSYIIQKSLEKYVQQKASKNLKPKDISKNSKNSFVSINIYTMGIPAGCLFLLILYFWYSKTSSNKNR